MKAKRVNSPVSFVPYTIEIKIESLGEAKALYAIFNHTDNTDLLGTDCNDIRKAIGSEFRPQSGEIINSGISYDKWYTR